MSCFCQDCCIKLINKTLIPTVFISKKILINIVQGWQGYHTVVVLQSAPRGSSDSTFMTVRYRGGQFTAVRQGQSIFQQLHLKNPELINLKHYVTFRAVSSFFKVPFKVRILLGLNLLTMGIKKSLKFYTEKNEVLRR